MKMPAAECAVTMPVPVMAKVITALKMGMLETIKAAVLAGLFPAAGKIELLLKQLYAWQEEARQGSIAELIWRIYSDTGYYELVGGMPGGDQRQANLRAYMTEHVGARPPPARVVPFLRFIERLRDREGTWVRRARWANRKMWCALLQCIRARAGISHCFLAGLSKQFNLQDLRQGFLLHKELGLDLNL